MSRSSSNSSPPHTPSSVVTAVKATQRSPFFHARLQRGLRIDSPVSSDDSSFTSSHAARLQLAEAVLLSTGSYSAEQIISARNGCDEKTQEARGYPTASFIAAEKSPFGQGHASTTSRLPLLVHPSRLSAKSRPLPASSSSQLQTAQMPMPAADQDFWASIADAPSQATPTSRRYHYLTRSQSTGAFQQSPKMRKKNASYNAAFDGPQYQVTPSPLRAEYDLQEQDIADSGSSGTWLPAHRHLSPIDEGQFFPDKRGSPTQASGVHGDAISMHSSTSRFYSHLCIMPTFYKYFINSYFCTDEFVHKPPRTTDGVDIYVWLNELCNTAYVTRGAHWILQQWPFTFVQPVILRSSCHSGQPTRITECL